MGIINLKKRSDSVVLNNEISPAVRELNDWAAKELAVEKKYLTAIVATKRAIAIEPDVAPLWCNLGNYYWNIQRFDEALAALERSIVLNNTSSNAWGNLGLTLGSLKRFDEADAAMSKAIEIEPNNYDARWNRGLLRLSRGDYARGWEGYEARLVRNAGTVYRKFPGQEWHGEDLTGKILFIGAEQGIGDNIMFSRFLPQVATKAGKVIFCSLPMIQSLLWEFRHIVEFIPEGVPMPEADYYVHLASLPACLGITLENLTPDPGLIKDRVRIQQKIGPVQIPNARQNQNTNTNSDIKRIGICWSGSQTMDRNEERSVPLELLLELLGNPEIWLVSLQVGSPQRDISRLGADRFVFDASPQLMHHGLPGTGTAIAQMDLVITCCTSVAHLAGVLGIPCWVLLCYDPYWVWGHNKETSKWYPNIRLFRQRKAGDWAPVLQDIQQALTN